MTERPNELKGHDKERTTLPWRWEAADEGTLMLCGPDTLADYVLDTNRCKACIENGSKCTWPGDADADYILEACNNHERLTARIKALEDAGNAVVDSRRRVTRHAALVGGENEPHKAFRLWGLMSGDITTLEDALRADS